VERSLNKLITENEKTKIHSKGGENMKKLILGLMPIFALGLMLVSAGPVLAVDCTPACDADETCDTVAGTCVAIDAGGLDLGLSKASTIGLGNKDIRTTIADILRVAMGLLGIVAVVIILIGGFTWMTAGGNDEKVAEAKKWIFSGIIGLAIILSAYALSSWVIKELLTATGAPNAVMPVIQ